MVHLARGGSAAATLAWSQGAKKKPPRIPWPHWQPGNAWRGPQGWTVLMQFSAETPVACAGSRLPGCGQGCTRAAVVAPAGRPEPVFELKPPLFLAATSSARSTCSVCWVGPSLRPEWRRYLWGHHCDSRGSGSYAARLRAVPGTAEIRKGVTILVWEDWTTQSAVPCGATAMLGLPKWAELTTLQVCEISVVLLTVF